MFLRICNKYDAAYRLIGLIANQAEITSVSLGEDFFSHEIQVQEAYETIYKQRIKNLKISLLKAAFWTTLSILIANIASVLILELPVAGLLGYDFSWWAIFWDIMIPSIAMFALVMLIRPPRKENQAVVWEEISKILYQDKQQDVYEIRLNQKSSLILQGFFTDLSLAQKMVDNIVTGLTAADPEHADLYAKNAAAYKAQLAELDAEFAVFFSSSVVSTPKP